MITPDTAARFAHPWHAPRGVAVARKTTPVWLRSGALRCTHHEHAKRSVSAGGGHP